MGHGRSDASKHEGVVLIASRSSLRVLREHAKCAARSRRERGFCGSYQIADVRCCVVVRQPGGWRVHGWNSVTCVWGTARSRWSRAVDRARACVVCRAARSGRVACAIGMPRERRPLLRPPPGGGTRFVLRVLCVAPTRLCVSKIVTCDTAVTPHGRFRGLTSHHPPPPAPATGPITRLALRGRGRPVPAILVHQNKVESPIFTSACSMSIVAAQSMYNDLRTSLLFLLFIRHPTDSCLTATGNVLAVFGFDRSWLSPLTV